MDNKKEQEIPFGAFDSELMHQEINIPEGFEATIEGDKIILTRTESKDDEIRKELLEIFKENKGPIYISLTPQKKSFLISLLEKKTWSEEDEKMLDSAIRFVELSSFTMIGKGKNNTLAWLKSLKGRVQHKNHWKPSEEQMEVLVWCMPLFIDPKSKAVLESLIKDLKKL